MRITVLQAIAFCFEKDEVLNGWGRRWCPFLDEEDARASFETWLAELIRWMGPPESSWVGVDDRQAEWPDVRMRQAGRGIVLWIRPGDVWPLWHSADVWKGDPCDRAFDWKAADDELSAKG